jgi:hypothetical protein
VIFKGQFVVAVWPDGVVQTPGQSPDHCDDESECRDETIAAGDRTRPHSQTTRRTELLEPSDLGSIFWTGRYGTPSTQDSFNLSTVLTSVNQMAQEGVISVAVVWYVTRHATSK